MAKMKLKLNFKKLDFTKVKTILINMGEKIALGVIVVLGLWLVWSGLISALYANKNKDGGLLKDDFLMGAQLAKSAVTSAAPPVIVPMDTKQRWDIVLSYLPQWASYIFMSENPDRTRRNPIILPLAKNDIKIDFVKAGFLAYDIDRDKEKATIVIPPGEKKESAKLGETILPRRMLIVSALFPFKEQIEEFQNALKLYNGIDVEADKPFILGINVYKLERDPSDPKADPKETPLYTYDAKNKLQIADNLDDLFRRAILDPDALQPFANHRKFDMIRTNMPKMPKMPKMAGSEYPPLVLSRFVPVKAEVQKDKDDKNPNRMKLPRPQPDGPIFNPLQGIGILKKVNAPVAQIDQIPWSEAPAKENAGQFNGDYPVFEGQIVGGDDVPKKDDGKQPFPGFKQPRLPGKGRIPGAGNLLPPGTDKDKDKDKEELQNLDPLIRFFDVGVEPGHEYAYKIQVRCKNPNFNLSKDKVVLLEMAEKKELVSEWTTTKYTRIPSEDGKFYVVDQQDPEAPPHVKQPKVNHDPKDPFPKGVDPKLGKHEHKQKEKEKEVKKGPQPRGPDYAKADADRVAVQIHRWFDWADKASESGIIADWIVAERLLVRRGEYIGRPNVVTEAPTWSIQKNNFELVNVIPPDDPKKKSTGPKATGIKLDFTLGKAPPVLVDFEGGQRKLKGGHLEECPIELLAVNGDGKLVVHNSRDDTYDKERLKRYEVYRARLLEFARPVPVEEEQPQKNNKDKGPRGR